MPSWSTRLVVANQSAAGADRAAVVRSDGGIAIVVADGAGGSGEAGARAAETAVKALQDVLSRSPVEGLDPVAYLRALDQQLLGDRSCGETTAVVVALTEDRLVGASVGDSGAWLVHQDGYSDLTEQQVRKPLLGSGTAVPMAFSAPAIHGTLVIATDGLWKYARPSAICQEARQPRLQDIPERILSVVRLRSGAYQDDVAIVVCR